MPVFISYQRDDELLALRLQLRLMQFNVQAYLDVLDPELKSSEDVTKIILDRLESCTHLLALVSPSTVNSWWVPFEIGVATKGDRRIATFRRSNVRLPDYLRIWPVLDHDSQLEQFAIRYFQDSIHPKTNYRFKETVQKSIRNADQFHRRLKGDLGQA